MDDIILWEITKYDINIDIGLLGPTYIIRQKSWSRYINQGKEIGNFATRPVFQQYPPVSQKVLPGMFLNTRFHCLIF